MSAFGVSLPARVGTVIYPGEDRVADPHDFDEAVLVFDQPPISFFARAFAVERDYVGAESLADQLMSATNRQRWRTRLFDELIEAFDQCLIIKIEIAQRAAQNNRVRVECANERVIQLQKMDDADFGRNHQVADV